MIFVTVGTHEQQFDRLVQHIDDMVKNGLIKEKVVIQSGYTTYKAQYCESHKLLRNDVMNKHVKEANLVITHGGPGSIMLALQYNKTPIVVPRQVDFNEHVDNHQVLFTKRLENAKKVLAVYEIDALTKSILNYNEAIKNLDSIYISNTDNFVGQFESELNKLIN